MVECTHLIKYWPHPKATQAVKTFVEADIRRQTRPCYWLPSVCVRSLNLWYDPTLPFRTCVFLDVLRKGLFAPYNYDLARPKCVTELIGPHSPDIAATLRGNCLGFNRPNFPCTWGPVTKVVSAYINNLHAYFTSSCFSELQSQQLGKPLQTNLSFQLHYGDKFTRGFQGSGTVDQELHIKKTTQQA